MAKTKTVEIVEELITPLVQESGFELVDVEFVKEGGSWYLRIFIDKPGGIGIEACGYLSQKIDRLLDEKDPIPQSYYLEVSSPGLERPLKKLSDYSRFAGKMVVNVMAPDAPDKADAVHALVARCGAASAIFAGDDVNDEPVFVSAPPDWLTVRIGRDHPATRARYFLDSPAEMAMLLERMLVLLARIDAS